MSANQNSTKFLNDSIIKEISAAVGSLEYGTITIKVHNARIIQIEVAKRMRFDDTWKVEKGGGI